MQRYALIFLATIRNCGDAYNYDLVISTFFPNFVVSIKKGHDYEEDVSIINMYVYAAL